MRDPVRRRRSDPEYCERVRGVGTEPILRGSYSPTQSIRKSLWEVRSTLRTACPPALESVYSRDSMQRSRSHLTRENVGSTTEHTETLSETDHDNNGGEG